MKILLVEDDSRTEQLIDYALSEINIDHYVVKARDGDEAMNLLFKKEGKEHLMEIKLVVLDLKLPKVNGIDLLKMIRENPKTEYLPVIIFTSSEDPKDIDKCYKLGANGYTVKPTNFEEFTESVQTIGQYWFRLNQVLIE